MIESVKSFLQDEEGQSMVEYGVTLGAVAAVSYIAVVQLGDKTADLYSWMANHLPGGEAGEGAVQVRVNTDGLVNLGESGGEAIFSGATPDMRDTLGGGAVYETATGWNG